MTGVHDSHDIKLFISRLSCFAAAEKHYFKPNLEIRLPRRRDTQAIIRSPKAIILNFNWVEVAYLNFSNKLFGKIAIVQLLPHITNIIKSFLLLLAGAR